MNPVLLKPGSDRPARSCCWAARSAEVDALVVPRPQAPAAGRSSEPGRRCAPASTSVICEGAGSPAEINLRRPRHREHGPGPGRADLPVVVVGDIDRGGVFAALFGTLAVCLPERPGAGRGLRRSTSSAASRGCWRPGLGDADRAHRAPDARRPAVAAGPAPRRRGLARPRARDAAVRSPAGRAPTCCGSPSCACPAISNFTDVDALACEPGRARALRDAAGRAGRRRPRGAARAPGPPSPTWPGCGAPGLADALARRAAAPGGRCSGSAAATRCWPATIRRRRGERRRGRSPGSALLPATVRFGREKVLGRPTGDGLRRAGRGLRDPPRRGRRSRAASRSSTAARTAPSGAPPGTARVENDGFRRAFLRRGRGPGRPTVRARPRTSPSRRCASAGSTRSATWSPTISTPTRCCG